MSADGWTAVGLSNAVLPGMAIRAVVRDLDMAIWRGQDGVARAWENRCPHRGMRLSYGMVRGNTLTCLYHGWSYNGDGGCAAIPAHPALEPPRTIQAVKYDCRETAGMIWVSTAESPDASFLPRGNWTPCRSLHLESGDVASLGVFTGRNSEPKNGWTTTRPDDLDSELLLAVQPMGARGVMLHGAVGGDVDADRLVAASRWMTGRREEFKTALAA